MVISSVSCINVTFDTKSPAPLIYLYSALLLNLRKIQYYRNLCGSDNVTKTQNESKSYVNKLEVLLKNVQNLGMI